MRILIALHFISMRKVSSLVSPIYELWEPHGSHNSTFGNGNRQSLFDDDFFTTNNIETLLSLLHTATGEVVDKSRLLGGFNAFD